MTHPDFRKQGIFLTLAREVYRQTRLIGVQLVYGFPNDNSFHGFVTDLDFIVLENIVAMTRPLSIERVVREKTNVPSVATVLGGPLQGMFNTLCSRKPRDAAIRIEPAPRFPETVTALFNAHARKFANLVIRDYRYLSWRYDRHPRHSYEILLGYRGEKLAGYCVSGATDRKGLRIGLIVDIFADPADRALATALVAAALEVMERKGMHLASCLLFSKSPFRAVLRRLGFVFPMRRFPFIVRVNADAPAPDALANDSAWHITFGDGDFV
jgi:GNAT superfamily N-acetyltransferase